MTNISSWKAFFILAVTALAFLFTMPNVVGSENRAWMEANLPGFIPTKSVNLGLDLRGGAHLLYEVDVDGVFKERADLMVQDLRTQLRDKKIGYTAIGAVPKGVRVVLIDAAQMADARKILQNLSADIDITENGTEIQAVMNEGGLRTIYDQTISQSIEIVRRRIDALGTTEPVIQRQGADATALKNIIGTTAKLGFHLVPEDQGDLTSLRTYPFAEDPMQKLGVERRPMITGDMLETAQPAFDQNGSSVISFRLNNAGGRRFCDVTRNNVNKPFAIVLDNEILSAPVIREPICGGSGQISGGFTVESANNLSLLLRAGALPAPMKVVEERTVGPSLGADSVEAGKKACLMALVFVTAFACLAFGLFGIFASLGLLVNMVMILGILSTLQATLTLPGIAGIVLTIGLAIDANVLIFERMKEEIRAGRSILSAIDTGYTRARTTIIDANLTALIAALILFSFGTGPVKGFAVTMCIGVATSYFCAMFLTRLLILRWLNWKRPKTIEV
jgi:preprotein translocase subunit SecD